MKSLLCALLLLFFSPAAWGADLSGREILERIDDNYVAENRKVMSTMLVRGRRGTRTLRWYPKRAVFKDVLAGGEGTESIVDSIEFNVDIPDSVFSKASLR